MGYTKKTGKGRLDKYYHLAKEQGYRARSAFKLIQLNKKYNFLEKSRVLVDLCAAPGGWLQVAAKYMPVSSIIIGVDLAPIKPIPNVTTFVCDITTEKCRAELKKELTTWQVDTFLHDGAPNVGKAWLQDAYSQSELVLKSLKLATEFMKKGGTFVTKVFRSKDYNSLMWVFNQLFAKVEATKPASSRNVSAEIFVICREFKAPKKIDPKFLDPKYVFEDLEAPQKVLNIFKPEKNERQRQGYADGVTLLFKTCPASQYIESDDPAQILGSFNKITFEDANDQRYFDLADEDLKESCKDLKVLGKKEFRNLLKWRMKIRKMLKLEKSEEKKEAKAEEAKESDDDQDTCDELDALTKEELRKKKRAKRKLLTKKAKDRERMQLDMNVENDTGEMMGRDGLFHLDAIKSKKSLERVQETDMTNIDQVMDSEEEDDEQSVQGESENELGGSDDEMHYDHLESSLDQMYEDYVHRKQMKEAEYRVAMERKKNRTVFDMDSDLKGDESSDDEEEGEKNPLVVDFKRKETDAEAERKTDLWFSQPIFGEEDDDEEESGEGRQETGIQDVEMADAKDQDSDDDECIRNLKKTVNTSSNPITSKKEDDYEVVKAHEPEFDINSDDKDRFLTAEGLTTAMQVLTKKGKREAVDDSFNRYSFRDTEGLPAWFIADEQRHSQPQRPVTKQAVQLLREKTKALSARPIKKVMEAKARKKNRALRRLERMTNKANVIADADDIPDAQKLSEIQKLMKRGKATKEKKKPKLVVAKGANRGNKGRPKGVKGRYKMVDPRMKKELRAEKRKKQNEKKRRR